MVKFLRKFGSRGKSPDQFLGPRGIRVDWQDNIYVADYGNE